MRSITPSRVSLPGVAGVRAAALAVVATVVACGRSPPSARFVGESTHFRLYVDPDLTVAPDLADENGLVALETAWSDAHTMLGMPDGKITYYWLTAGRIADACGTPEEGACIWEENLEIDSATLPNAHELNHAYLFLRRQREPIPFLAEGIADAIGCELHEPMNVADTAWPPLIASPRSPEVYLQGAAFVRHLIRRFGIDQFLRYYEQSPERRDPAVFGANFSTFWGRSVDEIWTEIHDRPVNQVFIGDTKICPCSLPPVPMDGAVVNDRARAPYWTVPPLAGQTLALTAGVGDRVYVQDCAGVQLPLRAQGVLARLDETAAPRFVLSGLESAAIGPYLADDCAATAPYAIGPAFRSTAGLSVAMSPPPSGTASVYVQLTTAFSWLLSGGLDAICGSCGFDPGACPPYSASAPQTVQGTFYGRMTLYTNIATPNADTVGTSIVIQP